MEATHSDPRKLELLELQKQHKHMELDRRAYTEESQSLLRKQQTTIDKLRRDNDSIKGDISMLMRSSCRPLSSLQQDAMHRMHDQGDKYANAIEYERRNIEVMEDQINIMKQKCQHQRRTMGGVNASKDNFYMIQKQIRILENRLDKALIKFNEAIAHNKVLRDDIDDLRRERVVFENIYRKMERELQDRKQKMAEIIETSNQSYEQRDTYQMEVAAIEQANRKEQEEFEEQMVELARMLESGSFCSALQDCILLSPTYCKYLVLNYYIFIKSTELRLPNPNSGTKRMTASSSTGQIRESMSQGGMMDGTSSSPSKGLGASSKNNGINRVENKSFERVQNFEEAFNKIIAATGITDIEELVRTFIKNEDHNFSLFNYVNEQNNEIEKLDEQIQLLREEERKFALESGEDFHQHKQVLKELENKLQTTDSMAEKYEIRCQDLQRVIESLKRGIQSIYEKFDVDEGEREARGDRGYGEAVVTESNMVHYLGLIEQRANLVLQNYAEVKQSVAASSSKPPSGFLLNNMTESSSKGDISIEEVTSNVSSSMGAGLHNMSLNLGGSPVGPPKKGATALGGFSLVSVLGSGPKVPMGQDLLHVSDIYICCIFTQLILTITRSIV